MANEESYQEHQRKNYFLRILEEKLAFIITVPIAAMIITVFVFHFYRVDGSSMEKTFQNNDLLIVEKLGKTSASVFRKNYVPKRYDVIVFSQPSYDPDEELVKRVIGLPGDKVVIKKHEIKVFEKKESKYVLPEKYFPPEAEIIEGSYKPKTIKIKDGEVFVLGDNRPGSDDSRFFGTVKTDNIVGRVIVRLLPFKNLLIL